MSTADTMIYILGIITGILLTFFVLMLHFFYERNTGFTVTEKILTSSQGFSLVEEPKDPVDDFADKINNIYGQGG